MEALTRLHVASLYEKLDNNMAEFNHLTQTAKKATAISALADTKKLFALILKLQNSYSAEHAAITKIIGELKSRPDDMQTREEFVPETLE